MARLKTGWLLSILLFTLPNCRAAEGPPAPPSQPECSRTCDEKECSADIDCNWDQSPDPKISTNYTLHWRAGHNEGGHAVNGSSLTGSILRESFSRYGELHVWVQARNQYGFSNSQEIVFNAEDIIKPPPPKFSSSHVDNDTLEIHWSTACGQLGLFIGPCEVRNRTEEDQTWLEYEGEFHGSYTLMDPKPSTVYEFQVRCSCNTGLMSEWSAIHRIKSAEAAPVGKVDVWRDCVMFPTSFDCYLTWKNLSRSQARGVILGYEVRISYHNGSAAQISVPTASPSSPFVYDEKKWCLISSLKDVSSVSVSAYNALGATVPSYLAMPLKGKEENDQTIHLKMNEENLTVYWDLPSQLSNNSKEYVVQYKQAECPAGKGFDWIKVKKSRTTGFTGQFKKYTPYQVSLFKVSPSREIYHLTSLIGYSQQKAPSAVPSFKVASIDETEVTLDWEPVRLSMQNGLNLYYQIGGDTQEVYNVSAHENKTFKLQRLRPGQYYEVWIRAVNAAGPGPNLTTTFKTKPHNNFANLIGILGGFVFLIIVICLCACQEVNKVCPLLPKFFIVKVPDPSNSHIFKEMKGQMHEPLTWNCITIFEPHPKISRLEIVEIKSQAFDSAELTRPVVRDGCSQMDSQDDQRDVAVTEEHDKIGRYRREEYSKMVDSDEERDHCWSSSEDEQSPSGYEQHFMPTAMEILEL